jgi:TM2 domain-containing membrane protein YozV
MTTGPDPSVPDPSIYTPPTLSKPPPPPPPPPAGHQGPPPPPPGVPAAAYGVSTAAPYGLDPRTGIPYSDKQKMVAGLLQILLPFGIGRYYIGDTNTGIWQTVATVLTCGLAHIWVLIDGILMLVHDDTKDAQGYILRP